MDTSAPAVVDTSNGAKAATQAAAAATLNALKGGHFAFCEHPQKEHTDIGHNVELQQMQIDETQLTIKGLLETITSRIIASTETVDFDPETPEPDSDSIEDHMIPGVTEPPMLTERSTRVRQAPVSFKAKARQTIHDRYNHDDSFRTTRDALFNTKVRKYFPGYGIYTGVFTLYYQSTDTHHLLFDDGDEETDSYDNIQKYIEGTAEYDQEHKTALALTVSFDAAMRSAATMTPTATEPNH
jgi:hypothetical protein